MTEDQKATLRKMPYHRVLTVLSTGAVVVVFQKIHQTWMVVDTDGRVYNYRYYFSFVGQRS